MEHTISTKVVAPSQLLQWYGYLAVVILQHLGMLPSCYAFYGPYWHTFEGVSSLFCVAVVVRRDSVLHAGDFTEHLEDRLIVLEVSYHGTPT